MAVVSPGLSFLSWPHVPLGAEDDQFPEVGLGWCFRTSLWPLLLQRCGQRLCGGSRWTSMGGTSVNHWKVLATPFVWIYEVGWYHSVHDCLWERHGARPNWYGQNSLTSCALTHALQISAQFFLGCVWHCQVVLVAVLASHLLGSNFSQNPVLVNFGRRYSLLESANGLH